MLMLECPRSSCTYLGCLLAMRSIIAQVCRRSCSLMAGSADRRGLLWPAGPLLIRRGWNPSDMISTIRAEDAFDIGGRLAEISAPTLVIGGGRDRFYPTELFIETASRTRLILY